MVTIALPLLLAILLIVQLCLSCQAFSPLQSYASITSPLFAGDKDTDGDAPKVLTPATNDNDLSIEAGSITPSSSTVFMISRDMRRILIEELGYPRKSVDVLRVELAAPIIEKRISCPADGIPEEWLDTSRQEQDAMLQRLENESKYPLKVPLFFVSGILFGKGSTDAIVTLIKVSQGFKGASLMEEFMGVNVLAIDAVCVVAGIALGVWTYRTMRDDQ